MCPDRPGPIAGHGVPHKPSEMCLQHRDNSHGGEDTFRLPSASLVAHQGEVHQGAVTQGQAGPVTQGKAPPEFPRGMLSKGTHPGAGGAGRASHPFAIPRMGRASRSAPRVEHATPLNFDRKPRCEDRRGRPEQAAHLVQYRFTKRVP